MSITDVIVEYWPSFVIPFIVGFCFVYGMGHWIIKKARKQTVSIDFNDYKEKELGDMRLFKDKAEFDDYKEF